MPVPKIETEKIIRFFVPFPVEAKGIYCSADCRSLYNQTWDKPYCIIFGQRLNLTKIIGGVGVMRTVRCEGCTEFEKRIVWDKEHPRTDVGVEEEMPKEEYKDSSE